MALTEAQHFEGARSWIRKFFVEPNDTATFDLDDLKAAFAAVDAWADNQASFVASLPEPFKSNSTAAQKSALLAYVAIKRTGLI